MNNGIEKHRVIQKEALNTAQYMQSLMEEAFRKGVLTEDKLTRVQTQLLTLLAEKAAEFSGGESCSIRVEHAERMMSSILFTIGVFLKRFPQPDEALQALQNESIDELYRKGRKQIDRKLAAVKSLHKKLVENLVQIKNIFYRATIVDGIAGFFKLYKPDSAAQEIHITADYPTCNHIPELLGIEFISAYVNALYYENSFLSYFSAERIHSLLRGAEKTYQEQLMNLYEPVFAAAIGCVVAGTDVWRLNITETGLAYLSQLFTGMSEEQVKETIEQAAARLIQRLELPNGLKHYLNDSVEKLVNNVIAAAEKQMLKIVFCLPADSEGTVKIRFSFGEKMDDGNYRALIEELDACNAKDKISVIKAKIKTLSDLNDVLLDADLTEDERQAIFLELSMPEIAALINRYQVFSDMEPFDFREDERTLNESLRQFMKQLPTERQEQVEKLSDAMMVEE